MQVIFQYGFPVSVYNLVENHIHCIHFCQITVCKVYSLSVYLYKTGWRQAYFPVNKNKRTNQFPVLVLLFTYFYS